jgi:scyllo-inositol 2-dehydrogenase (NADP+)
VSVNVVCVGAGWAAKERHLPSLVSDPRVRVVGIIDRHAERAEATARRFSIPSWSTSLDEDWASEVACLTIGAPPWAHGDLIEQALERGWHCLCEKPFVLPASRGTAIVERAAGARLVLAVVHNFQFSQAGRRLFELIESGGLGDLTAVYGYQLSNPRRRLPHWAAGLPGGLFLDETPHFLYLLRRILGRLEVRTVDARLDADAVRDIWITLDHESIWAQLTMNFNAPVFEWQLLVVGSEAAAAFDLVRDVLVVVPSTRDGSLHDQFRSSRAIVLGHARGFASSGVQLLRKRLLYGNDEIVRRFVDAVEGEPERIRWMTGPDGVATIESLETILGKLGLEITG